MRRPGRSLAALALAELLLAAALAVSGGAGPSTIHGSRWRDDGTRSEADREPGVVSVLLLTDLALFPGTSYSRHPSQADGFAPFSDHPAALEHTPAGSLLPIPPTPSPWSRRSP